MSGLGHADDFRDLVVYSKARAVSRKVFQLTKTFPRDEMFSLTDQMRRSVRSIGAQITEAWAKRRYERHFVSKLTDADAEQRETQHWIEEATDCEYLSPEKRTEIVNELKEIGKMLNSMMNKSSSFCGENTYVVRESLAEYFISADDTDDE